MIRRLMQVERQALSSAISNKCQGEARCKSDTGAVRHTSLYVCRCHSKQCMRPRYRMDLPIPSCDPSRRYAVPERETRGAEDLAAEAFAHPNKAGE